jgi:phosphopantetheinyl transferase (holo-ACP synthase)
LNHVGNDVVDLKTPEARNKSLDVRFIQKTLNHDEQRVVFLSENPDSILWAIWAAKETAYKAVSKSIPDITSAPRYYPVALVCGNREAEAFGAVYTPGGVVPVKIFFHSDYVHCIGGTGCSRNLEEILFGLGEIGSDEEHFSYSLAEQESLAARKLIKNRIASCLGRNPDDIHVVYENDHRDQGPPKVSFKGQKDPIDISLSHDGRFAAYAFLL